MPAPLRILHLLAQRPSLTGSGVTLDRLASHAADAGWEQYAVVGAPVDAPAAVAGVPPEHLYPLRFESLALPFPVPGMSDVMPYPSTRYASLDDSSWRRLRVAWYEHLDAVAQSVAPAVIHSHHLWLMTSLVRDAFPGVPVVMHCHATGLRQMQLCRDRAPEIVAGLRRNDAVVALDTTAAASIGELLDFEPDRIRVVGAGFREDLFHSGARRREPGRELLYVGKIARAKGLHCLLDAFERLAARDPRLRLHVAGGGAGIEADRLRDRLRSLAPRVRLHGQLDQPPLADLMRSVDLLVLPSFYEGLPLVLAEAVACGCRVVATDLPGVRQGLAPALGTWLTTVEPPAMASVDEPRPDAVAGFVRRLAAGIDAALASSPSVPPRLSQLTWSSVFERVEGVWHELIGDGARQIP